MDWKAQHVQFALFASPSPQAPDALQAWTTLFGIPPETFQRPRGPVPVSQATGQAGAFQITVAAQPGRIDVFLADPSNQEGDGLLEDVDGALAEAERLCRKALEAQRVLRVALVVPLVSDQPSQGAANKALHELLPFISISPAARDVIFQINEPRAFPRISYQMNRLCTWSSAILQRFNLTLQGAGQVAVIDQRHVVSFQIDVNSATTEQLRPSQAKAILSALVAEARQLKSAGYPRLVG